MQPYAKIGYAGRVQRLSRAIQTSIPPCPERRLLFRRQTLIQARSDYVQICDWCLSSTSVLVSYRKIKRSHVPWLWDWMRRNRRTFHIWVPWPPTTPIPCFRIRKTQYARNSGFRRQKQKDILGMHVDIQQRDFTTTTRTSNLVTVVYSVFNALSLL